MKRRIHLNIEIDTASKEQSVLTEYNPTQYRLFVGDDGINASPEVVMLHELGHFVDFVFNPEGSLEKLPMEKRAWLLAEKMAAFRRDKQIAMDLYIKHYGNLFQKVGLWLRSLLSPTRTLDTRTS